MKNHHRASALAAVATMVVVASPALAQGPRTPSDLAPIFEQSRPTSKSDAQRIVGKVLEIDRQHGRVKLSTDEGERVVQPNKQLLGAVRVGDMISVPRPSSDEPVSASPRTSPSDK
jgi:hypothetical protein